MSVKWGVAVVLLLAPSAASARQALCGAATVAEANAEVFVTAGQQPGQPPTVNSMTVEAFSPDRSVSLSVSHDLVGDALGSPTIPRVTGHMDLPEPEQVRPERLAWRIGDGSWTGPQFSEKPRRRWGDPARVEGYLSARLRPQDIPALRIAVVESTPVAVRRLSEDGSTLAESTVRYPAASTIRALYAKARASAVANLKPCKPPLLIPPVRERALTGTGK